MKRICGFIMVLIMLLTGPASAIAKVSRNEAKLLCLNIGKADCMLLLYGNTNWLIDTGYEVTYNALKTALDEYQIDHLDGVFLTHCHEDHDGGLMPLAQSNIPVNARYGFNPMVDDYASHQFLFHRIRYLCMEKKKAHVVLVGKHSQ